ILGGEIDSGAGRMPRYLATVGRPAATSKFARDDRKEPGFYDHYCSVCAVSSGSALKSDADLKAAIVAGRVRFLCTHPASVSSRIAPAFALEKMGVELRDGQIEYTHSHSASLRLLT